jgi:hypothetical protein
MTLTRGFAGTWNQSLGNDGLGKSIELWYALQKRLCIDEADMLTTFSPPCARLQNL